MTASVGGGDSGVNVEAVQSFSSAVVTLVVRVPRAFITSLKVDSDSPSDERRSGGGWALFLILVFSPFFGGFIYVFNFGAIVRSK